MDEYQIQVAGRLTALGFVLEVLLANELAAQPVEHTEVFKQELLSGARFIQAKPQSVIALRAIQAEAASVLERFVEKVREREADIRRQREGDQQGDEGSAVTTG
ncbi:hypothetical protein G7077_09485 [Sphingomonas piscis]|uniref:Uncharacterized protein n=1 Tax=Sphingomonas piscis TaxID=2714943 RepID=A0A6G7YQS9_9SPHN|nr:hypothetical protein [Sphingomonas piscis]QIK79092.1 hypothetical protein G7077_09485 [Sphingomonas piscis]